MPMTALGEALKRVFPSTPETAERETPRVDRQRLKGRLGMPTVPHDDIASSKRDG